MSAIILVKMRYSHSLSVSEMALNFRSLTACCELIISLLFHLRKSLMTSALRVEEVSFTRGAEVNQKRFFWEGFILSTH